MSTSSAASILAVTSPSPASIATSDASLDDRLGMLEQRRQRVDELLQALPKDLKIDARTRATQLAQLEGQAAELELQLQRLRGQARTDQQAPEPARPAPSADHLVDVVA